MLDNQAAVDVESAVSAHLMRESQKMEEELLQARSVQRYLLPPEVQEQAAYRTAFVYHPLHHVGGDFLDTLVRPDGKLVLMIADVSGHGMAAALSSAMLKTAFMRHAGAASGPGNLLTLIDGELQKTVRFGRFVTAMVAWFDIQTRRLSVASAGHPPALLMRNGQVSLVEAEPQLPLFTGGGVQYPDAPGIQLQNGDRVLLMTDGVLEATRSSGEMITAEELTKVVSSCPMDGNFAACVFESLFFSDLVFNDDVSLLALEVR
ncbi:MAG TPA: PP2C family protein-serine/threonine phosphatase [Phycisphaerae bacterium]|nr:PP2C family protein-serine/threonine phosphatase [Phycisphaerae bacterium]